MSGGFQRDVRAAGPGPAAHAPLPAAVREQMRERFGENFDDVRVDAEQHAAEVSAGGADALTVGGTIAFGVGAFRPGTGWGHELIAHELAHVLQQRGGTGGAPTSGEALEAQADTAAQAALRGGPMPALSPAPVGAQPRVSMRDVGRGEQSGFARVPELVERMNHASVGLVFTITRDGDRSFLAYTRLLPVDVCSGFDRQMMAFIDDGVELPLRFTNRHGLLGTPEAGYHDRVFVDAWQSGYVDIDDLLASSDLGLEAALVHFLRERQRTPNYVHRMGIEEGPGALDVRQGHDQEFQAAHASGIRAELELLRDFFSDPTIRLVDADTRRFRNHRGDTIRVRTTNGQTQATAGVTAISWEVVLHDTHRVVTDVEYLAILDAERAAAPAAPLPAPAP